MKLAIEIESVGNDLYVAVKHIPTVHGATVKTLLDLEKVEPKEGLAALMGVLKSSILR